MSRHFFLAALILFGAASSAAAQTVSLTLRDGRVTLITQNATPAAILAEWARQGQTRVVDAERVTGAPLTLRLENVSEREALDVVLRGAAGYIAAPRAQGVAGTSRFDRIIVMATSPGAATARATPMQTGPAVAQAPPPVTMPVADEQPGPQTVTTEAPQQDANEVEQPVSSTNFDYANPQRYFAARQQEQQQQQAAAAAAGATPAADPAGTVTPGTGMFGPTRSTPGVLPMPANAGQPGAPGAAGAAGPAAPQNPYGLPANQSPGSSQAPPNLEPDRSKYVNPYSPTPVRPPGSDD